MSNTRIDTIIGEVNSKVVAEHLARLLDYHPAKIEITGSAVRCFCPLHQEQAFRSLLLEIKSQSFRCTMKRCVGFEGGSFVDLWALHRALEPLEAALELAEKLKLDIDVAALRAVGDQMLDKARQALEGGKLDEARQAAEQAAAFLPRDPAAGLVLAEIHRTAGEPERAREETLRVIDLMMAASDVQEARELLAPLLEEDPDSVAALERFVALARLESNGRAQAEALTRLAEVFGRRNDPAAREKALADAIEAAPDEPGVMERVAALHEADGRIAQALEIYERLCGIHQARRQWPKLLEVLERRRAHDSNNLELAEWIAEAHVELGDKAKAADAYLRLANFHKKLSDNVRARQLLDRLLAIQPDCAVALELMAAWTGETGDPSEAIQIYRRLAALATEKGDGETAARYLSLAKDIDPDDLDLRRDLAETRLAQGQFDEGVAELFELAQLFLSEADPAPGFEILERVSKLEAPDKRSPVDLQVRIARTLESAGMDDRAFDGCIDFIRRMQKSGNHQAALGLCEEAERLAPGRESLLELRLKSCAELGDKATAVEALRVAARGRQAAAELDKAEDFLLRAGKLDRTEPSVKIDLAHLYELQGRIPEAVQIWIEVALLHRAAESRDRSIQAAREALRLDERNAEAGAIVAEHLEAAGQTEQAIEMWKTAARNLAVDGEPSARALATLEHALKLSPGDADLLEAAAEAKFQVEGEKKALPLFEKWLDLAVEPAKALAAHARAVERYPERQDWRVRLADLLIDSGSADEAAPHLEQILKLRQSEAPDDPECGRILERLVRLRPDRLELRRTWAEWLADAGDLNRASGIFAEIAHQYLTRGDRDSGLEVLESSLQRQPENRDLLIRVAELREQCGQVDRAVESYERLLSIQRREDEPQGTVRILEKLLLLQSDRDDLRLELAQVLESRGDIDAAVEHYHRVARARLTEAPEADATIELCDKLIELAPEFTPARQARVECLTARGDAAEAKAELARLADLTLRIGELSQAEGFLLRALEIDGADVECRRRLARIYETRGQHEKVVLTYRHLLEILDGRGEVEQTVEVLAKLKELTPEDLELYAELARRLTDIDGREEEAREQWCAMIAQALAREQVSRAHAAMAEAASLLKEDWDRRIHLTRMFDRVSTEVESLSSWRALARETLHSDQPRIAMDIATEALEIDATDVELRETRIEAARRLRDWESAEADLRLLAEQRAAVDDHKAAEGYYARAIEIRPDDPALIGRLADCQIALGKPKEAQSSLRRLADLHRDRGEMDLAIHHAERMADLAPESEDAADYLASLCIAADQIDRAMEIWRAIAERAAAAGDADKALLRYDGLLLHRDRDLAALRRAAELTAESRGPEAALARWERLLEVVAEDAEPGEALDEFDSVLEKVPDRLGLVEKRALYLHSIGRTAEAAESMLTAARRWIDERQEPEQSLRVLRALTAIDPDNLQVREEEATVLEATGDVQGAIDLLREVAAAHRELGREEEAASAVGRCAKLAPQDIELQVEAAEIHEGLDLREEATRFYLVAIELYDRRRDWAPCVPLLKRTIALNPDRTDLGQALGQVYEQSEQPDKAARQFLEVGRLHERLGDPEKAVEFYTKVKHLDRDDLEARDRLARLAEVSGDAESALGELRGMIPIAMGLSHQARSVDILKRILSIDPSDLDSRMALAHQYRRLAEPEALFETLGELERLFVERDEPIRAVEALEEMRSIRPEENDLTRRIFLLLVKAGENIRAAGVGMDLVQTYLRDRRTDVAAALIGNIVEIEPENVERRVRLAQIAVDEDCLDIARQCFTEGAADLARRGLDEGCLQLCEAALELFADDVEIRLQRIDALDRLDREDLAIEERLSLAELHVRAGAEAEAEALHRAILADRPDDERTHEAVIALALDRGDVEKVNEHLVRLAEIHYVGGRIEPSIAALERLLEHSPDQVDLQCRLAELHHESGNAAKAREVWLEAAEKRRDGGDLARAIEVYERVSSLNPTDIETLATLTECYGESGEEEKYADHAMRLARTHMKAATYGDAITVLETLTDRRPKSNGAWAALAECYERAEEPMGAVRCHKVLYELHRQAKKFDPAREALERALELRPNDAETLQQLGDICLTLKRNAQGIGHLTAAARQLFDLERFDEAAQAVERVLKIEPANLEMRRLLGDILQGAGDDEGAVAQFSLAARGWLEKRMHVEAIALFERLLDMAPDRSEDREAYARALEREGRAPEAVAQYLKLIDALGSDADPRQAIRYCRQILNEHPDCVEAHLQLFRIHEKTDKPRLALKEAQWLADHYLARADSASAEEYIRRGLELAPGDVDLRKKLIELYIDSDRTGDAADALSELSTLAQERSDSKTARWALGRACEIAPDDIVRREQLAELQERAGETREAIQTRLEVLRLRLDAGDMEEAREIGDRLADAAPHDETLRRKIAEQFELAGLPEVAAFHYAVMAKVALTAGRHDRVYELTDHILKIKPRHTAARQHLMDALVADGEIARACEQARLIHQMHVEAEDYEAALPSVQFLIKHRPAEPEPRRWSIDILRRLDRPDPMVDQMRQLVEIHARAADIQGAIEVVRELMEIRPDDTVALSRYIDLYAQVGDEDELYDDHLRLAAAYRRKGSVAEATGVFEKLLARHPERVECREAFIEFLFEQGQINRGVAECKSLVQLYMESDRQVEAGRILDRALAQAPGNTELRHHLATIQLRTNRRGLALETLRELLKQYESLQDAPRLIETLELMLEIDELNVDLRQRLAELCTRHGMTDRAIEHRKVLAEQYLSRQLYDLAEREYRRILDLSPADAEIWQQVIETHLQIGSRAEVTPDMMALAELYLESGRIRDAIGAYRQVLDIEPNNVEVLAKHIEASLQIGVEEDLIDDYLRMATLKSQAGDVETAMKIYARIQEIDPKNARAAEGLRATGGVVSKPEKNAKSPGGPGRDLAQFVASGEDSGKATPTEVNLEKSIRNYANILKLNPENPVVRAKLAALLSQAGRREEADKEWTQAAHDFFERADYEKCVEIYHDLIERDPDNPRLRERLSRAKLQRESVNAIDDAIGDARGAGS